MERCVLISAGSWYPTSGFGIVSISFLIWNGWMEISRIILLKEGNDTEDSGSR